MGQASVGQRPLLSQERSSCAGQAGRAGSAVRPEQINLSEGCLESPTGPSSERKEESTGLRRDSTRLFPLQISQKTFLPRELLPPRRVWYIRLEGRESISTKSRKRKRWLGCKCMLSILPHSS